MGLFEDGLAALQAQRQARTQAGAGELERALHPARLAGARFVPGDQVVDKVTGQRGKVVRVRFSRASRPAP
jgi:hypothetical protein